MTLTVASLFDGIGGFCLAFKRAGADVVATVEIDSDAAAVSHRHFPNAAQFPDVTKVTANDLRAAGFVPERGILTAGWPCQDNSVAGRRAGLDGARSGLWWEVVRLLAETRARWFIGENVPGLLSVNDGRDFGAVLGSLGELGYGFAYRVLDAQYFGVPQSRDRVFIVGHLGNPWSAPAQVLLESEGGQGNPRADRAKSPALDPGGARRTGLTDAVIYPLAIRGRDGGSQLEVGPAGGPYNTLRAGDGGSSRQSLVAIDMRNAARSSGSGAGTQGDGIREGGPSYAITALQRNVPGVGLGTVVRRLTELECERLQGYPDGWTAGQSPTARYRQLGNTVAVPVVEWVARRVTAVHCSLT